jgi:peptidoglycan/LPS O-acetylase OafA/YrhL
VRRDRWLLFLAGVLGLVGFFGLFAAHGDIVLEWGLTFVMPWSIYLIFAFTLMSWGWALFVLSLAMTGLNFTNRWLVYGTETIMPFYLLHQPVIIVVSYFVVQWDINLWLKLLIIGLGSLALALALIELLVRPFGPVRKLFGMKPRRRKEDGTKTALP